MRDHVLCMISHALCFSLTQKVLGIIERKKEKNAKIISVDFEIFKTDYLDQPEIVLQLKIRRGRGTAPKLGRR